MSKTNKISIFSKAGAIIGVSSDLIATTAVTAFTAFSAYVYGKKALDNVGHILETRGKVWYNSKFKTVIRPFK